MIKKYLNVCFKRSIKYLLLCLVLFSLFGLCIYALLDGILAEDGKDDTMGMSIGVGIVGDTDDRMMSMGIRIVMSNDASKDYLDVKIYDSEQEAKQALEDNEISAYLLTPPGYVDAILHGKNTTARFIAPNSGVGLETLLINDALSTISDIVVESQICIFAMEDYYRDFELSGYGSALKDINFLYIGQVLDRDSLVKLEVINQNIQNPTQIYYLSSVVAISILLCGILCCHLVVKSSMSLSRLMRFRRFGSLGQVVCELVAFTAIPVVLLLLALIFVSFLQGLDFTMVLSLFVKLLPAVFALSFMQFFVYELCDNLISAFVFQFVVSAMLSYVSGLFYPTSFFPETLRNIAKILPVGSGFNYIQSVISNELRFDYLSACVIYSALFLSLSVLVRNVKIRSEKI